MKRFQFINSVFVISLISILSAISTASSMILPDVWDWRPQKTLNDCGYVSFYNIDNDILINYANSIDCKNFEHETITFFGARKYKNPEDAFGVPPGFSHPSPIIGYSSAKLSNGNIVGINSSSECVGGVGAQIRIYNSNNKLLTRKSIALILEANRFSPDVICEESVRKGFSQRIVIFQPNQVVSLPDNTFLVSDLITGIVVRFDDNIHTNSHLLGKSLFLFDPTDIENRLRKSDSLYIFFEALYYEIHGNIK